MSGLKRWTRQIPPGKSVIVPSHRETYAQNAARTGQFKVTFSIRRRVRRRFPETKNSQIDKMMLEMRLNALENQ
jgi:hypothetical protein